MVVAAARTLHISCFNESTIESFFERSVTKGLWNDGNCMHWVFGSAWIRWRDAKQGVSRLVSAGSEFVVDVTFVVVKVPEFSHSIEGHQISQPLLGS